MKPIGRKDAMEQGLTQYYTGKPCKNGHYSPRYVNSYHCVECHSQVMAEYYKNNKDERDAKHREYCKQNPEKVREIKRKANKKYYENNPEKAKAATTDWQKRNPEKMRVYRRRSYLKRKAEGRV